jgi:hypothetical protein
MKQRMCKCIDNIRKSAVSVAGKETAQPERLGGRTQQALFTL